MRNEEKQIKEQIEITLGCRLSAEHSLGESYPQAPASQQHRWPVQTPSGLAKTQRKHVQRKKILSYLSRPFFRVSKYQMKRLKAM